MEINKYTKIKAINKNGCYYKKGTQIFFDNEHIGGYDEVRALEKENKLQDLLK